MEKSNNNTYSKNNNKKNINKQTDRHTNSDRHSGRQTQPARQTDKYTDKSNCFSSFAFGWPFESGGFTWICKSLAQTMNSPN